MDKCSLHPQFKLVQCHYRQWIQQLFGKSFTVSSDAFAMFVRFCWKFTRFGETGGNAEKIETEKHKCESGAFMASTMHVIVFQFIIIAVGILFEEVYRNCTQASDHNTQVNSHIIMFYEVLFHCDTTDKNRKMSHHIYFCQLNRLSLVPHAFPDCCHHLLSPQCSSNRYIMTIHSFMFYFGVLFLLDGVHEFCHQNSRGKPFVPLLMIWKAVTGNQLYSVSLSLPVK